MKKLMVIGFTVVITLALAGGYGYVRAQEGPTPEKGVLVGEVISIIQYGMKGALGEDNAEAGKYQVEEGHPVGLRVEETGEVFIACWRNTAPASHLETAAESFTPYMGMKVAVQGLIYRQKGVNVIRASLISEY